MPHIDSILFLVSIPGRESWLFSLFYFRLCYWLTECNHFIVREIMFANLATRLFHTSTTSNQLIKLTRLRVVDNSEIGKQAMLEGKPPRIIHVYNKSGVGYIGDKVLVAIKGEKKKGVIVGCKKHQIPRAPSFDSNNIVLIDDTGTPLGNRIHVPIPLVLRTMLKEKTHKKGTDFTKLLAISTRFV